MKTTDPRDPLDHKLDELLARQPLKAADDFLTRTLAAAEAGPPEQTPRTFALRRRFAMAIAAAAAIALACVALSQLKQGRPEAAVEIATVETVQPQSAGSDALSHAEIDELLLLEEGLSGFADLDTAGLRSDSLLNTLDALHTI